MNRVLITYGTTEGHTRMIAQAIASALRRYGVTTDVLIAGPAIPDVKTYSAIIVAASVHAGRYQRSVVEWVRARAHDFGGRPTAFVSVSLAVLQQNDPKVVADLAAIVQRFTDSTGWQPGTVKHVAGALLYTRYNFLKRWLMKRIVAKAGGETDTSRDYDYTDWADVARFGEDFSRLVAAFDAPTRRVS